MAAKTGIFKTSNGKSSTELVTKNALDAEDEGDVSKRISEAAAEVKRRFFILGEHLDADIQPVEKKQTCASCERYFKNFSADSRPIFRVEKVIDK